MSLKGQVSLNQVYSLIQIFRKDIFSFSIFSHQNSVLLVTCAKSLH